MKQVVLHIEGMSCSHCENAVKKALEGVDSVEKVQVSLEDKTATVLCTDETDESALAGAVEEQGYDVVGR